MGLARCGRSLNARCYIWACSPIVVDAVHMSWRNSLTAGLGILAATVDAEFMLFQLILA
jgi:hypothetical protein